MRRVAAGAALLLVGVAARPASATVALQAMSTTVSQPGDSGRICVVLSTSGGEKVAGIQNRLTWDGNCATLSAATNCSAVGSHGKQVHADTDHQPSFQVNIVVLSLGDVDPMPDGPVYCCNFQGEADPGQCCPITMSGAGASDPAGKAIAVTGGSAKICTNKGSDDQGRGIGSIGGSGPSMSTSNAPPPGDGGSGASAPPPPAGGPGSGGVPASQVLQGGGARIETPAAVAAAPPTMPALQLPTPPGAQAPGVAPAPGAAPGGAQRCATSAGAADGSVDERADAARRPRRPRTHRRRRRPLRRTVAPTVVPTKVAPPPKQEQAKPEAKAEQGGGWFGCQINGAASAGPVLGLGLLALVGAAVRRRRRAHRRPYP